MSVVEPGTNVTRTTIERHQALVDVHSAADLLVDVRRGLDLKRPRSG